LGISKNIILRKAYGLSLLTYHLKFVANVKLLFNQYKQ